MLDTATILNCRVVCTDWRDWFSISKTLWSSVLPKAVTRVFSRRVRAEVDQVWDIRLDLLLEMVDECWNEDQEMSMAIRIERASKQQLWREFEDTLKVVSQLHQAFSRGMMSSPCVGPVSIFLRCKVAHPVVLRVMGETLARHLNCVIIDEKDKEASVVRQCLLKAMISCQQAPRWVFKDFDLGWLEAEEDEDEVPELHDEQEHIGNDEVVATAKFGLFRFVSSIFSFVSGLFSHVFGLSITEEDNQGIEVLDHDEDVQEEEHGGLYCTAPQPAHPLFPTVLELLECDSPWLKKFLVDKVGIDKILVVPKFEEATNHIENIEAQFTLAGLDDDGSVCHLQCGALVRHEGAVVGYVDYPASNYNGEGKGLHFWGGRDIGGRWPVFEQVLLGINGEQVEEEQVYSDIDVDSEEWSDEDLEDDEEDCKDISDESQTSDLGVSPELSDIEESVEMEVEECSDDHGMPDLSVDGSGDGAQAEENGLRKGENVCDFGTERSHHDDGFEEKTSDVEK